MAPAPTGESASPADLFGLEDRIAALLRSHGYQLDAFLATVDSAVQIDGTLSRIHCSVLCPDGNGLPRVGDFAAWLAGHVVDYAIPRNEIAAARAFDEKHNTTHRTVALASKARHLFTKLHNSGEGGELLLYVLAQARLGLPQLFCKMPHKTNPQVHYHGSDGIHVGLDVASQRLALYWCESKLHATVANGVRAALDSITPFVCSTGGSSGATERDLCLLRDHLTLNDAELEYALLRYLDKDDPHFNQLQYRGVCLIGFDHDAYPTSAPGIALDALLADTRKAYTAWHSLCAAALQGRSRLSGVHLEIFLVPFPSVESFRSSFFQELTLG